MKKRILTAMLALALAVSYMAPVRAASLGESQAVEIGVGEGDTGEAAGEEDAGEQAAGEEAPADGETAEGEAAEDAKMTAEDIIHSENLVDVDKIDLSLHSEEEGEFSAVYAYENPFLGKDTSAGVILEFYANPTWEVHELGAIFAFNGSGDYDGKLYFSPGSYLGFNSEPFGGYFDANLYNYTLVTDYIKDGAKIRIELLPDGFAVYADDVLCYDQTILDDPKAGAGDFTSDSDFSGVLTWLAGADVLYFGYGSWWNTVGTNEANIDLSEVSFRLQDGTVVMDQLKADKKLVEALGGSVGASAEGENTEVALAAAEVEIFDINSVVYEGSSILPVMAGVVILVVAVAVVVVVLACKPRKYSDVA